MPGDSKTPTAKAGKAPISDAIEREADPATETPLIPDSPVSWKRATQRKLTAGFEYVNRGNTRLAKTSNDTVPAVRSDYPIFSHEIDEVRKFVRVNRSVSVDGLQKAFESSRIAKAADEKDWRIWLEDFVQPRDSAKAKSHALTLLERKTGLTRSTIKTYLKRKG